MGDSEQIKRQIGILGLVLTNRNMIYSIDELADYFGVSIPTINRDLFSLRSEGVDIHSTAKDGIILTRRVDAALVKNMLMRYLVHNYVDYFEEHIMSFFPLLSADNMLSVVTKLQHAIDKNMVVVITSEKYSTELPGSRYEPRMIFHRNDLWYLLISDKSEFRIFPIHKIDDVKVTETSFKPIHKSMLLQEINKITDWKVKSKNFAIRLEFSDLDKDALPLDLINIKVFEINEDGNMILEADIESMDKIAGWIFTQGKNLLTIEPPELASDIFEKLQQMLGYFVEEPKMRYSRLSQFISKSQSPKMSDEFKSKMLFFELDDNEKRSEDFDALYETQSSYGQFEIYIDLEICSN